jgi:hypothetical protein
MSLTQHDLVAIEEIVKKYVGSEIGKSEENIKKYVGSEIKKSEENIKKYVGNEIEKAKDELLEEIHKVGIEVVENRSIILQHVQNSPAWKHLA